MELNSGKIVYLNHYSRKRPIVSCVVEVTEECIKIHLTEKFANAKILETDPIVLSFEDGKNFYTCEGCVTKIFKAERLVEIRIDNKQHIDNNRLFERFPVSLYACIKGELVKKTVAVVKNISLSGMALTSKINLKCGQNFECDVYMNEHVITIDGEVAWKKKVGVKFEYGIKSVYPDYIVKNTVRLYLTILKEQQQRMVKEELENTNDFQ